MTNDTLRDSETDARETRIIENLSRVARIATWIVIRYHPVLDTDDIFQEGVIGLLDATRLFDSTRGVSFRAYAMHRVRGTIREAFRNHADMKKRNITESQREELSLRFLRHEKRQNHEHVRADSALTKVLHGEVACLVDRLLSARTRQIFIWHYQDEWSLAAIGRQIGISTSRVSQIHTAALARLRQHIDT